MSDINQTLVSTKYQVVIPKNIRKQLSIKPGQKMNIKISDGQIVMSRTRNKKGWKWPEDYIKNLKNPWEGEDVDKYLEGERNSWD